MKTVKKIKRRCLASYDDKNTTLKVIQMLRDYYPNKSGYSFRIINGCIYATAGKFYQSDWDFIDGLIVGYSFSHNAFNLKYKDYY